MGLEIETERLRLLPYSAAHLLALLKGVREFEASFGMPAADGLGTFFASDDVSPDWLARLDPASPADPWVHGFAVVDLASRSVIGSVGFKGRPDEDGVVEVAYGIVAGFQGRGLATEAAAAGLVFAFEVPAISRVRAHTRPVECASTRVLQKCGFGYIGPVDDPDDGPVWRWELERTR
jgi:ribosomal-protein-alanine N-acetyltransferase